MFHDGFCIYLGSLTTPPCYETVRWHVMKEMMTVTEEQMEQFRMILRGTNVSDTVAPNYRPVQPLNDRMVYECLEDVDAEEVDKEVVIVYEGENGGNWFGLCRVLIIIQILMILSKIL